MYKQKIITFFIIISIVSLGFNSVLPKKVAIADCGKAGTIEIYAGSTGFASAGSYYDEKTETCIPGFIVSGLKEITFNGSNKYDEKNCELEAPTTSYDATGYTDITEDQTFTFAVEGVAGSDGKCIPAEDIVTVIVHPAGTDKVGGTGEGENAGGGVTFVCPLTKEISAGDTGSFNLTATGSGNSVNFSVVSITPSSGTPSPNVPPSVVIDPSTNGQPMGSTTLANITSSASTNSSAYTIVFSAHPILSNTTVSCSTQLLIRGFYLNLSSGGSSQVSVTSPSSANFTITPTCIGTFSTKTIGNFSVPIKPFTSATYKFLPTSITCNQTTTLTVSNTGSVTQGQGACATLSSGCYKPFSVTATEVNVVATPIEETGAQLDNLGGGKGGTGVPVDTGAQQAI